MITYADYMDGKATHKAYYSQFVNSQIIALVVEFITPKAIRESTDKHMNDIPLLRWDFLTGYKTPGGFYGRDGDYRTSRLYQMALDAGMQYGSIAPSDLTCLAKAAARMWKEADQQRQSVKGPS